MAMEDERFDREDLARVMGPGAVDTCLRECIRSCWMMMPDEKKTINDVEAEIHRLIERAFKDMREDEEAFRLA